MSFSMNLHAREVGGGGDDGGDRNGFAACLFVDRVGLALNGDAFAYFMFPNFWSPPPPIYFHFFAILVLVTWEIIFY